MGISFVIAPLLRKRSMKVFVSSTFLDLEYERRFVIDWLRAHGFAVTAMEDVADRRLYWREWSMNAARRCDVYLRLFDWRVGSSPPYLSFGRSFSQLEEDAARGRAALRLAYRVRRPFSDWPVLVPDASKRADYLSRLDVSEAAGGSDEVRIAERSLRTGIDVLRRESWRLNWRATFDCPQGRGSLIASDNGVELTSILPKLRRGCNSRTSAS